MSYFTEFKNGIHLYTGKERLSLYHGAKSRLDFPVRHDYGNAKSDFGMGFCMADNPIRSLTFACSGENPFQYDLEADLSGLKCVKIEKISWAVFVAFNREKLNRRKFPELCRFLNDIDRRQSREGGPNDGRRA